MHETPCATLVNDIEDLQQTKAKIKMIVAEICKCAEQNIELLKIDFSNITTMGISPDSPQTIQKTIEAHVTMIENITAIAASL